MRFQPNPGLMSGKLVDAAAFPGETFDLNVPEMIGDVAQIATAFGRIDWIEWAPGYWTCAAQSAGECSYEVSMVLTHDTADIRIRLTNDSNRVWEHGTAFNHFAADYPAPGGDYETARHWLRVSGQFRRLHDLSRKYSSRPGIQLFNVVGAPPVSQIPFANSFQATPDFTAEGWLAVQSRDGTCLIAIVSKPALFLFQNSEFNCIHSAPDFGKLVPGQMSETQTRIYIVQSSLKDWYKRMRDELF